MPSTTKPRSWRRVGSADLAKIRALLLQAGASEDKVLRSPHEAWRLRYADSIFTAYISGTIYCNGGVAPELGFLYEKIAEISGQSLVSPTARLVVGLDETGKGEVLGHAALAAVKVRSEILPSLDKVVSSVDTKKHKSFDFWDKLIQEIDAFRGAGLEYLVETIPPWDLDRYNVNKILDVVYQRLLGQVLRGERLPEVRVIIDDYGIGANLEGYLDSLHAGGSDIRVEAKADEHYPEVRTASVIAKWRRELAMKRIDEKFAFSDQPVGSGNAGDPATLAWLARWKSTNQPWPWFVKRSFSTIRGIDGGSRATAKLDPPIRHELLSTDSRILFGQGRLSTSSITIVCPQCGRQATAAKLTPAGTTGLEGRCVSCNVVISDLDTTLRYYCGLIVPDTSVLLSGAISTDLEQRGFFGAFTLLLPTVVAREADQPGGRKELARLGDYAAMGRISMHAVESEVPMDPALRDTTIIETTKLHDAILVTRDGGMYGNAVSRKVFCLTFRTTPGATP
jgi:ribonuclease HII